MARRVIGEDDVGGSFLKMKDVFPKVGAKFVGNYVSNSTGSYGEDYTFEIDGEEKTLTVKGLLEKQLAKAAPQPGEQVTILFSDTKDTGHDHPMRLFKVLVDDAPAAKSSAKPAAKAPAKAKPAVEEDPFADNDIPF